MTDTRSHHKKVLADGAGAVQPATEDKTAGAGGVQPAPALESDPEVPAKAQRRQFSAEYKLRILQEADACEKPGEIGALLRREGLYSSVLSKWRAQRERGALAGLTPAVRGRKATPEAAELARLRRENARLTERLAQAETIIQVQKKLSTLLGLTSASEAGAETEPKNR